MTTPHPLDDDGRAPLGAGLGVAAACGLLASVAGFIAAAVGIAMTSGEAGVPAVVLMIAALRTVLTLLVVLAAVYLGASLTGRGTPLWWAGMAGAGIVLDIWAWGGNALLTASVLSGADGDQGVAARVVGFVVDLIVWVAVAWFAARAGLSSGRRRREGVSRLS